MFRSDVPMDVQVRSDAESRLVQQMAHYEARCVGAPRLIASRCWTRDQEMPERSRSQRLKELLEKQCPHPFEANVCCEVVCFKDLRKAQGWGNPFRFCACSFWQVLAAEQPLLEAGLVRWEAHEIVLCWIPLSTKVSFHCLLRCS